LLIDLPDTGEAGLKKNRSLSIDEIDRGPGKATHMEPVRNRPRSGEDHHKLLRAMQAPLIITKKGGESQQVWCRLPLPKVFPVIFLEEGENLA
jgi:hypothetical protein